MAAGDGERRQPVVITVRTKEDMVRRAAGQPGIPVSVVNGIGLKKLRERMLSEVYSGLRREQGWPLVTRRRQIRSLRRALECSQAFVNARDSGIPPEVAATHLLDAQHALEELVGVVDTEDVLDVLFSTFCVGK